MKESKTSIDAIILRHLTNPEDDQNNQELHAWLLKSEENRKQFELLKLIWETPSEQPRYINGDEVLERIWKKGMENPEPKSKRSHFFKYVPRVAAALLIGVIVPLIVVFVMQSSPDANEKSTPVYIVKENPATERSRFILPDGSMVWLHCSSTLRYPAAFSTSERRIELIGEAFFEVKKDSLRPFIVNSGSISTTALGTSFNVEAYPKKNVIEVALITGKVKVESNEENGEPVVLNSGVGITYNKSNRLLTQQAIDKDLVLAWKSGILIFDGDDYHEFIRKIEQWYGVTVATQGKVPTNWRIRGRFDNDYLANVLDVISFNKDFTYQINDKHLTFFLKKKS